MEKFDIISNYPYLCGESPMWDSEKKQFWWTDMLAGHVYKYDPPTGQVTMEFAGKNVSGFTMKKGGGLVMATHQGVYTWNEADGLKLVAEEFAGNRLACNDAAADARGRFLFGSAFYGPHCQGNDYPLGKLFSVGKNGSICILDEGIHLSNGIGFSPDNTTMYYTDTVTRIIYAYDYKLDSGAVSNRRIFVKVPDSEGIPDGLTVDADGYVWSAQWYGSCIVRYDPDGKVERRLQTPALQTSSVMFGGENLTDLYVTSAAQGVKLHCAPRGFDFHVKYYGGPVYRYRLGIQGKAEPFAEISI